MSLIGFKAQNHKQQVNARGAKDAVDDRGTSPEVFGPLMERFAFTIDVAASENNTKCPKFYTKEDNGLEQSWMGERVWCNPPYSDCGAWVRKAWQEWVAGAELIVMLLPANRVEQSWWQDYVEPFRDRPGSALKVEFLRGRMRFIRPNAVVSPKGDRPPFGVCLLIWERY